MYLYIFQKRKKEYAIIVKSKKNEFQKEIFFEIKTKRKAKILMAKYTERMKIISMVINLMK